MNDGCVASSIFLVLALITILMLFAYNERWHWPRCRDCGVQTPGGRRCHWCAHEHVETVVRWGEFCRVWTRIGIAAFRQSRGIAPHMTGVYR